MLIGVVGKANVGKSTFFKAATLAEVEIADYPFVTINPNEGIGFVRVNCADKDFNVKCQPKHGFCLDNNRFVPVQLLDVAGLIPGAHLGKGLGNQFLDDLRQADCLIHVIDVSGSTNEKGEPISALSYDPANDVRFLEEELDMWYFGILKKSWERFSKQAKMDNIEPYRAIAKQFSGLKVTEEMAKAIIKKLGLNSENASIWSEDDLKNFAVALRKQTKPMVIAANKIDVPGVEDNFVRLKKEFPGYIIVPCSAESELALREAAKHKLIGYVSGKNDFEIVSLEKLNEKQKNALDFVKTSILEKYRSTGVQDTLNKAVFELLKYIAVYPVATSRLTDSTGTVLPDCFLVPKMTTALDFAFRVHTDIGKNFVKAVDLRTKQIIGKESLLKHSDVIEIVTSK